MKPRIVAAEEIASLVDDQLSGIEVVWLAASEPLPPPPVHGIVSLLTRRLGPEEMDAYPELAVIANVATGFDNIDLAAAAKRGVVVTNTPDVLTEATADLTLALILATVRRIGEGIELMRSGRWDGWHPTQLLGRDLNGATLGIVGAGRIGSAVARRSVAFGMQIMYTSPAESTEIAALGGCRAELPALLRSSDCVTLHVPLTPVTTGLIGPNELQLMRRHATLINTARGGIVDEDALLAALDAGRLAGAGLDVFDGEPRVREALLRHPRVLALPHIGSATVETRRAMADLACRNAAGVVLGRPPISPVAR